MKITQLNNNANLFKNKLTKRIIIVLALITIYMFLMNFIFNYFIYATSVETIINNDLIINLPSNLKITYINQNISTEEDLLYHIELEDDTTNINGSIKVYMKNQPIEIFAEIYKESINTNNLRDYLNTYEIDDNSCTISIEYKSDNLPKVDFIQHKQTLVEQDNLIYKINLNAPETIWNDYNVNDLISRITVRQL